MLCYCSKMEDKYGQNYFKTEQIIIIFFFPDLTFIKMFQRLILLEAWSCIGASERTWTKEQC